MFDQLITSQKTLREKQRSFKAEIMKLLRKVPIDVITKEFLNKEKLTIDARAYVIDKIVPVVVLGLEKLLIEADRKGLIGKEIDYNFNPINFLAQYLMRNNPLFANFNEASPYVRGLRQVAEELKVEIFHLSDNKLAKIKASAKSKREEREKEVERKKLEAKRRIEIYQKLFDQFLINNQTKVDYETVHLSIKSFSEIVNRFPEEMKTKLSPILKMSYSEAKENKLTRRDFGLLISHYADNMPLDIFDHFADHLSKCAKLYRFSMEKETRRKLLSNLFVTCDLEEMGLLDRQRILMLFDEFYQKTPDNIKAMLRDPKQWPITEKPLNMNQDIQNSNLNINNDFAMYGIDGVTGDDTGYLEDISKTNIDDKVEESNLEDFQEKSDKTFEEFVEERTAKDIEETDHEKLKEDFIKSKSEEAVDELVGEIIDENLKENAETNLNDNNDEKFEHVSGEHIEDSNVIEDLQEEEKKSEKSITIVDKEEIEEEENEVIEEELDETIKSIHESDDTLESEKKDKVPVDGDTEVISKPERHVTIVEDLNETLRDFDDLESQSNTDIDDNENEEQVQGEDKLQRELTKLSSTTQSTAYDEHNISFPQFFQITEEFLGDTLAIDILEDLIEFIREGYQETPEERLNRLKKARRIAMSAQRKILIDELFNTWDKDNSGTVNMNEISETLKTYKNGMLVSAVKAARKEARMSQRRRVKDIKLNRKEFRTFIYTIARETEMLENENETETMVKYFITLVQRTYIEKLRGEARRKWLNSVFWAAEISCGSIDSVYRAVFQAMYKDAEQHGDGKKISSSIAMLETNILNVDIRGKYILHFMVSTSDQTDFVVGKVVDSSSPNIYFQAIHSGNVVHLPHSSLSSNVIYWNPDITDTAKEGAIVIVPVKDDIDRIFGIISVDTLNDPYPEKTSFYSHEIFFYQGLAKQFSSAFHHVQMLRRLIKVSESAISWICRRILSVKGADMFLREKQDQKSIQQFVLRHVLSSNDRGEITRNQKTSRIEKNDNLFKTYLFEAVETSQSIITEAYGEKRMAIPLRDIGGMAVAVIDINIGGLKFLPNAENIEVSRMMGLLQQAFNEIIKLSQLSEDNSEKDDEANKTKDTESLTRLTDANEISSSEMIFDQLMLADLRANVAKLDAQAYAELRSYKDPPVTIHAIIQTLLIMLHPKEAETGLFKNWEKCKKYISVTMGKLILSFDPFGDLSEIPIELISETMNKIPHSEIDKHSSKPALDLYNWVFCCNTLIQHRMKMNENLH